MTLKKAFVYTIAVFTLICLVSYLTFAQELRLSLKEALALTLTNNREIKIMALDVEKSQQQVLVAKSQGLPSAGISGEVAHFFKAPPFFGFTSSVNSNNKIPYGRFGGKDQVTATIYIQQPVYNAATRPAMQHAQLSERMSRLSVKDKETVIAALLKQTYIQVLVQQERLKLQKESVLRNEKALQDSRALLAQGRALRVDTLRAYTSVKNLEPDLVKLSYAIEVGKQQLKTLMGVDSIQEVELSDSLTLPHLPFTVSEEDVYREAMLNRADLQALGLEQQLGDQQVKLAAAPMKPSFSLQARYLVQTQANSFNYFNALYPSTPFVGAQVTVPLFAGYSNKAKVKLAKIEKDESIIRAKNAYEELKVEVKQVVANLSETTARVQTRTNVKNTALLSYDITQYRYARGVTSRLELADAELALTTAQSNYLEAVYDYLSAQLELDRTVGRAGK